MKAIQQKNDYKIISITFQPIGYSYNEKWNRLFVKILLVKDPKINLNRSLKKIINKRIVVIKIEIVDPMKKY